MVEGKLKLTQREIEGNTKASGRKRQVYIKSDVEKRALEYCKDKNVSMSLLIRVAILEHLERFGY